MTLRSRLQKVTRQLQAEQPGSDPLTIVLTEATSAQPPGQTRRINSAGLPVLEIVFDPEDRPVELPKPPFKLMCGADPIDLV